MYELVEISRKTKDISISGRKGEGKTIILSLIGFMYWYYFDYIIFSNYDSLIYPHIYIPTIFESYKVLDLDKRKPKLFLGDDFERWIFSRLSSNKENIEFVNDILLDWGKANTSLIHTQKRSGAVDIGLRESDSEFWNCELKLKYISNTGNREIDTKNNYILSKYMNFLQIEITRFDENMEELQPLIIDNLHIISKLYDTFEVVRKAVSKASQNERYKMYRELAKRGL